MNRVVTACCIVTAAALAACHHGNDSSPPPAGSFTIGGTVTGLAGTGLVLRNNGGNDLAVAANGAFVFAGGLANGAAYAVTVRTQPSAPTQDCVVGNGSGTVAGANVANITVTCTTRSFNLGGTVSGLTGTGLMLRDDVSGVTIPVNSGSTTFQFPAAAPSGSHYLVTIAAQPAGNPAQVCTLGNGAGVVGGADTAIAVICDSGTAKFVYVPDPTLGNVAALRVDAGTGTLVAVLGSPFATGAGPSSIVATPLGTFVYVLSQASGQISGFAVDAASGVLTPVPGSPFAATGGNASAGRLLIDPSGRFLYAQQNGSSLLFGHAIDASTGALTAIPGSPFTVPTGTATLVFDPLGRYAYSLAGGAAGASSGFRIDAATGALTAAGTPVATVTQNVPVGAVHPGGSFVYDTDATRVHALKADLTTGQLSSIGTDFTGGGRYARIDPLGRFLYLTRDNEVVGFAISAQSGVLAQVPGSPFQWGTQTESLDIDPSGSYLYVPSVLSGQVAGFKIDPTTGTLAHVPGSPYVIGVNTNPNHARVDKSGRSLFVSSFGDDKLRKFTIAADGSLSLSSTVSLSNVGNPPSFILVGTQ
ncbi:MAG TPA: beta-propeller fold lactonase family protein [Gammaproteobacteria bacterium]|nr:beta-propeller fold lactonase family protein [Gammaproteobacteria bacterium]